MIAPDTHIRIARPSRDLNAAERFYTDGLGLDVLWRTTERVPDEHGATITDPDGYRLVLCSRTWA